MPKDEEIVKKVLSAIKDTPYTFYLESTKMYQDLKDSCRRRVCEPVFDLSIGKGHKTITGRVPLNIPSESRRK